MIGEQLWRKHKALASSTPHRSTCKTRVNSGIRFGLLHTRFVCVCVCVSLFLCLFVCSILMSNFFLYRMSYAQYAWMLVHVYMYCLMHDTLFVYSCVESAKQSIFDFCSPGTGAAPMVALPCLAASSGKILRDCLVWKEQGFWFSLQVMRYAPSRILPMNSYNSY